MRHWDKPPPDTPDPFEARWLREKHEREAEALRQLEKKLMHAMNHSYRGDREKLIPRPEPAPIVRGDYLVYYLGGPLNCTQEYFWDKQTPKDRDWRDIPEKEPLATPDTAHAVCRVNRYMISVVPKNETPFSTVQVYLAIYQEPPL